MSTIVIKTSASSRDIKKALGALAKSKSITQAYKILYVKHYIPKETGGLTALNIQLLVCVTTPQRTKSASGILDNILKEWKVIGKMSEDVMQKISEDVSL